VDPAGAVRFAKAACWNCWCASPFRAPGISICRERQWGWLVSSFDDETGIRQPDPRGDGNTVADSDPRPVHGVGSIRRDWRTDIHGSGDLDFTLYPQRLKIDGCKERLYQSDGGRADKSTAWSGRRAGRRFPRNPSRKGPPRAFLWRWTRFVGLDRGRHRAFK
jgi:hypothetical protein